MANAHTAIEIASFSPERFAAALDDLAALLINAVEHGGSVTFLPPLPHAKAHAYWQEVGATLATGGRMAWGAWDGPRLIGCVMLEPAWADNGKHRAEVQKMLVHTDYRGQGIAKRLMAAMEDGARQAQFTLLVLDTEQGGPGEQLYAALGYQRVGAIPQFARLGDGSLCATVFFYKLL